MARLPATVGGLDAPRGMRPSGEQPRPTDLGLGAVGENLADYAQAKKKTDDVKDDIEARRLLDEQVKPTYEPAQAQRAETFDWSQSGYAQQELGNLEAVAKPVLDAAPSVGVRNALSRHLDAYKAQVGDHVINVESVKRAEPLRAQRQAVEAAQVGQGLVGFTDAYAKATKPLYDAYDGSQAGFADQVLAKFDEATPAALEGLSGPAKDALALKLNAMRLEQFSQAIKVEQAGANAFVARNAQSQADTLANAIQSNPAMYDTAKGQLDTVLAGVAGELRPKLRDAYENQFATSYVEGLLNHGLIDQATRDLESGRLDKALDPKEKERLTKAAIAASQIHAAGEGPTYAGDDSAAPGFAAAAQFVVDALEGGEALVANDNGKGMTKFGINQAANPGVNIAGLDRAKALKIYKAKYWDAVEGDRLPPGLALVAFDAAVNQGQDKARGWLAQSGGDIDKYLALREKDYRALAASSPAQAKNLPVWLSRLNTVRERVGRIDGFLSTDGAFQTDPLNYAMGDKSRPALLTVPSLSTEGAFSADQGEQSAWIKQIRQRQAAGQMLHREFANAPDRMLTNAEAKSFEDHFQKNPADGVKLGEMALRALGPSGAQKLLIEVGLKADVAPVVLHLADLAANGGATVFTDSAARGLELRQRGERANKPEDVQSLTQEFDKYSKVFSRTPEVRLAAQQTAEAAMLADRASGIERPMDYYTRSALGAVKVNGQVYGGPIHFNGVDTIVPRWLNPDYMDDALGAAADVWIKSGVGPVWANGVALTAREISKRQLVLQPDGRYLLADPRNGSVAMAKNGTPFLLDMEPGRGWIASKFGPKAVRGGR